MVATVITAPELHEQSDEAIARQLTKYVPAFRTNMDQGAGDLIGALESIVEHELWHKVGCESLQEYAERHLGHSEKWIHEIVYIYNREWGREQRSTGTVGQLEKDRERNEKIRADVAAGKTQAEVAAQHGLSQGRVSQVIRNVPNKRSTPQTRLQLSRGTDPDAAARRIRERFGEGYAVRLAKALA